MVDDNPAYVNKADKGLADSGPADNGPSRGLPERTMTRVEDDLIVCWVVFKALFGVRGEEG